jgi:hypothetical protein
MPSPEGSLISSRRRRRRRRRRVVAVIVAGALVLAAAIVISVVTTSDTSPRPAPDLGAFSGYVLRTRRVSSVRGSWVVPRLVAGDRPGAAAIWIAAEGSGATPTAPFIQVGVNLVRTPAGDDEYSAFWTDTARGFMPRFLTTVLPGDRLVAGLTLRDSRWHVALKDLTDHVDAAVVTAQDGTPTFNEAQWLQEDPARHATSVHRIRVPYAATSVVRFRALRADGRAPEPGLMVSEWMSLAHTDLGPTPLAGDSFEIVNRRLSPAAARYVEAALPDDRAEIAFFAALRPWLRGAPARTISPAASRLSAGVSDLDRAVSGTGWPGSTAATRAALSAVGRTLVQQTRRAPSRPPSARAGWYRSWRRTAQMVGLAARRLRGALGAPDFVPPPP